MKELNSPGGEGSVRGSEYSEGASAFQRFDQISSLYSGHKRSEVSSGNCGINYVHRVVL